MQTWLKSGASTPAHAVNTKGSSFYITLRGVVVVAKNAFHETVPGERCPACVEKINKK